MIFISIEVDNISLEIGCKFNFLAILPTLWELLIKILFHHPLLFLGLHLFGLFLVLAFLFVFIPLQFFIPHFLLVLDLIGNSLCDFLTIFLFVHNQRKIDKFIVNPLASFFDGSDGRWEQPWIFQWAIIHIFAIYWLFSGILRWWSIRLSFSDWSITETIVLKFSPNLTIFILFSAISIVELACLNQKIRLDIFSIDITIVKEMLAN